ncbi:MAG: carboxypeptidase-like regulatory domain-containing protein [Terracidiphilus sp.]
MAVFAQSSPAGLDSPRSVQISSVPSGSLAGRLTDLHSAPLVGVSVALRNQTTGAEVRTTTAKNGAFRFASLGAGEYTLEAEAAQLGRGQLEGILITGGNEARVQAAMRFEPAAPALLEAAAPTRIAAPSAAASPMPLAVSILPAAPAAAPKSIAASAAPASAPSRASSTAQSTAPDTQRNAANPAVAANTTLIAARPALSISRPAPTASIATEPLRSMSLTASRDADGMRPSAQPAAPAAVREPRQDQPETHAPALPQRAVLETQSVEMHFALAVAPQRTLPLASGAAPAFAAAGAPAGMAQAALLNPSSTAPGTTFTQMPDPVTPVVATTVTAAQLQALPASGRRWQEFLLDTPAASASADSSQASFRNSQESAEIAVDGASIRLAFGAAAGSGSRSQASDPSSENEGQERSTSRAWNGGRGLGLSEAAIHEVTTAAGNVEAEGLRSSGGRTAIRTESGGNALHGQAFLFDRQNTWGARNPYTQWVTETAPAGELGMLPTVPVFDNGPAGPPESYTPPDHEIVWGLGAGSHIRRDKLFWFTALDSYHRNDPGLAMVKYPYLQPPSHCGTPPCASTTTGFFAQPSNCQMQLLSAQLGLTVPGPPGTQSTGCVSGLDAAVTAYSQMLGTLASLLGPAPRNSSQWTGFGRIDWQAAERHRFALEGIGADLNAPGGGLTRVSENYGSNSFGSSHASQQWLLARWEAYLTPNLLAVTQGSAGRTILTARPGTPSEFEKTFLPGSAYGQLPQIVVDSRYGFTIGNPSRFGQGSYPDEKLYHAQEMLDWVHGHLLVRSGFELDHDADAVSQLRNQTGTYVYSKVQNFIADALVFEKFGFADALDPANPHNCDVTGKPWQTSNGQLMGLGAMPCYSHYSQTIGPTNWHLSTNEWAGYATAQWQLNDFAVFSAGLRWEREQMPPPIAALDNPNLPFTEKLPDPGNNWGPRISLAIGNARSHWPVLRLGYGMYYGRVENATVETALTQTGSLKGDLYIFIRPNDGYTSIDGTSAAPPFPYVLTGPPASVVKPSVVGFAPNFRNPEIHQAVAAIEQPLPGRVELTASAMLSLGRRLPVFIDTNLAPPPTDPQSQQLQSITYDVCDQVPTGPGNGACGNLGLGPIKATRITVPFYASTASAGVAGWLNPDYQQTDQITSKANSTYEAAMVKLTRYGSRGLSFHAHYTYSHTMDWNPNESPMDPADFSQEYGTSNLDIRHSAAVMLVYEAPWKLRDFAGRFANGWMLSGIGQFRSGLPYTMHVTGSLPQESIANGTIVGLRPGMNGSGGDNRVYGVGNDGQVYNIGRNTYRYPNTWKADLRLGKKFDLGETRQLELLAESFNLFNHQNVTEIETTGYYIENSAQGENPTLNFLTGLKTNPKTGLPIPAFGQPLNINGTDFYRERQIQFGLRMKF